MSKPEPTPRTTAPKASSLAIAAFVLALIPCLSLMGMVLATITIVRIRQSGGRIGGKRLAHAAMIIGFAVTMLTSLALMQYQRSILGRITIESERIAEAVFSPDADVRDGIVWSRDVERSAKPDVIAAFIADAESRFGSFQSFAYTSHAFPGNMGRQVDVAGLFTFEDQARPGSLVFIATYPNLGEGLQLKLMRVVIDDASAGALTLPPVDNLSTGEGSG
ncbi:MAG: hypothetical protein AAF432_12660 [Planctomycetota bacterium]